MQANGLHGLQQQLATGLIVQQFRGVLMYAAHMV